MKTRVAELAAPVYPRQWLAGARPDKKDALRDMDMAHAIRVMYKAANRGDLKYQGTTMFLATLAMDLTEIYMREENDGIAPHYSETMEAAVEMLVAVRKNALSHDDGDAAPLMEVPRVYRDWARHRRSGLDEDGIRDILMQTAVDLVYPEYGNDGIDDPDTSVGATKQLIRMKVIADAVDALERFML